MHLEPSPTLSLSSSTTHQTTDCATGPASSTTLLQSHQPNRNHDNGPNSQKDYRSTSIRMNDSICSYSTSSSLSTLSLLQDNSSVTSSPLPARSQEAISEETTACIFDADTSSPPKLVYGSSSPQKEERVCTPPHPPQQPSTRTPSTITTLRQEQPQQQYVVRKQPFFIMDWFEEMISDQDMDLLCKMLKTPQKHLLQPPTNTQQHPNGFGLPTGYQTPPKSQQSRKEFSLRPAEELLVQSPQESHEHLQHLFNANLSKQWHDGRENQEPCALEDQATPRSSNTRHKYIVTNNSTTRALALDLGDDDNAFFRKQPSSRLNKQLFPATGTGGENALFNGASTRVATTESSRRSQAQSTFALLQQRFAALSWTPSRTAPSHPEQQHREGVRFPNTTAGIQTPLKQQNNVRKNNKLYPPSSSGRTKYRQRCLNIGNGWNTKGLQKAKKGLWLDAISCWEQALHIRCAILGQSHLDVANTYNNIGIALGKIGQWDMAVSNLQMALEIRIHELGTAEHELVSATIHNLANVHHQAGDLKGAIHLFRVLKLLNSSSGRVCVKITDGNSNLDLTSPNEPHEQDRNDQSSYKKQAQQQQSNFSFSPRSHKVTTTRIGSGSITTVTANSSLNHTIRRMLARNESNNSNSSGSECDDTTEQNSATQSGNTSAETDNATVPTTELIPSKQSKQQHNNHLQVARACIAMGHIYVEVGQYKDAKEAYLDAIDIYTNKMNLSYQENPEMQDLLRDVRELDQLLMKSLDEQHEKKLQK